MAAGSAPRYDQGILDAWSQASEHWQTVWRERVVKAEERADEYRRLWWDRSPLPIQKHLDDLLTLTDS